MPVRGGSAASDTHAVRCWMFAREGYLFEGEKSAVNVKVIWGVASQSFGVDNSRHATKSTTEVRCTIWYTSAQRPHHGKAHLPPCQHGTASQRPTMRYNVCRIVRMHDILSIARLKRQLESARGIIKTVAKGESSDGTSGNKRLRLGGAGGRDGGASRSSALTGYVA